MVTLFRKHSLIAIALVGVTACFAGRQGSWVVQPTRTYLAVSVSDIDRASSWYRQAFGVKVVDDKRDPRGAWRMANLQNDHVWIELIEDSADRKVTRAKGFVKFGFFVQDVREVARRVAEYGEPTPRVVSDSVHRLDLIQLNDPDGNLIQVQSVAKG